MTSDQVNGSIVSHCINFNAISTNHIFTLQLSNTPCRKYSFQIADCKYVRLTVEVDSYYQESVTD